LKSNEISDCPAKLLTCRCVYIVTEITDLEWHWRVSVSCRNVWKKCWKFRKKRYDSFCLQLHRYFTVEKEGKGEFSPGPARFVGPAVAQKYKVHQNAALWKAQFKKVIPIRAPLECFSRPRCGSRRSRRIIYIYIIHSDKNKTSTMSFTRFMKNFRNVVRL